MDKSELNQIKDGIKKYYGKKYKNFNPSKKEMEGIILVFAIAWDINTIGKLSNDLIEKIKTWDINENA